MRRPDVALLSLALAAALVLLPMTALVAYALAERWDRTLFPEGFTTQWILQTISQPRVQAAAWHTAAIASICALLAVVIGLPASVAGRLLWPAMGRVLDSLALLPFTLPPVVMAIGALELFVGQWGQWVDVRLAYAALVIALLFPLVHKAVGAAITQLDLIGLVEASRVLGAPDTLLLRRVVLPMLMPAAMTTLLLCMVTAALEFVIANLLLGGTMELLQPLMNSLRGASGQQSAALIVITLLVVALVGVWVQKVGRIWTR